MQALLVQLDVIFLQEHICSAAPTVVEDYKGTAALNRELEVIFPHATWNCIDAGHYWKFMTSHDVYNKAWMCRHLWSLRSIL